MLGRLTVAGLSAFFFVYLGFKIGYNQAVRDLFDHFKCKRNA